MVHKFEEMVSAWLSNCPEISRLAFGTSLVRPTDTADEALRDLAKHIPNVDVEGAAPADVQFRINRPRSSKSVPGTLINRLARWSVAATQTVTFEGNPSSGFAQSSVSSTAFASKLELDVNTSPDVTLLRPEVLPSLSNELLSLATELAVSGDRR